MRILIVDSDIGFSVRIKRTLEEKGEHQIRTVTRLRPALRAIMEQDYEMVVVNLELAQAEAADIVHRIKDINPAQPFLLTGKYAEEVRQVVALEAHGFLQKPYSGEQLIQVAREVIQEAESSYTARTQAARAITENDVPEQLIDPMLEASQQIQPPIPPVEENHTISEVIEAALNPEVSQRIFTSEELDIPDSEDMLPEPPISGEDSSNFPATKALSSIFSTMDLMDEIRSFDRTAPVIRKAREENAAHDPSGYVPSTLPEVDILTGDEDTRYARIPGPTPIAPAAVPAAENKWQEVVEEAGLTLPPMTLPEENADPYATIFEEEVSPEEEEASLVQTSIQELSEELDVISEVEMQENEMEESSASGEIPESVLAHYALQLTRFSLESSAQAMLLTRHTTILARAGDIPDEQWATLLGFIHEAWEKEGHAHTRIIYRRLISGDALFYSVQTVHELTLTLIFSAEMPLKAIRRQASRLSESLRVVPEPELESESAPEAVSVPVDDESEGEPYQESDREAQESEMRESRGEEISVAEKEEAVTEEKQDAPQPPEPEPQSLPAPQPVKRSPGTYAGYAFFWLLENTYEPIDIPLAEALERWIQDICREHDWDFQQVDVRRDWLTLYVDIPVKSLPGQVISTLMQETARRALEFQAGRSGTPENLWSDGYLISTPSETLTDEEISRFINFYRQERVVQE